MINSLLDLYSLDKSTVLFKHVECNELLPFANNIEKFRLDIQYKYDNDEHLKEVLGLLNKMFFKLTSSLTPYNKIVSEDIEKLILSKFIQIKNSYPELFLNIVIPIAKSFKQVTEATHNNMLNYLCEYINKKAHVGLRIAIVTKRAISVEERLIISKELKLFLKISYYTENSFRKDIKIFDDVIYIGNPNYFGEYVKNTFKGRTVTFISYDIFTNSLSPKKVFEDLDRNGSVSTIFTNVIFDEPIAKKSNFTIEQSELLNVAVSKFIEEQKNTIGNNSQDAIEACIIYLENERFLFAARDSKIRVFTPMDQINCIKQRNFKDIEEDDYIVIRNERDTKLIAEVADQYVLKNKANSYRKLQNEWKDKLRLIVQRKGLGKVSGILMRKYNIKTASLASLRSWCNEESICPTELTKILKALKYEDDRIKEIYEVMKKIQQAHIKAGRVISEKLMSELSNDILKELQEKGYYTFMSKEFNGVSFNIERIVSIDRSTHLIAPYNIMRPMNID
ncbi:DrmE family protein [Bacillus sp. E(2018)]|uniref:DrmE family protein n=1 Tax=Bacillus sp. E(2018) TaxID=2502239 RepID=UPI0010F6FA8F|nr:DrmE family protein [Bacillus sp. E(2018)]